MSRCSSAFATAEASCDIYSGSNTAVQQSIICYNINMSGGNISQPATSSYFSNGGASGGAYLVE